MRYRERRLRKAERLREWSDKRERKSAAAFNTAKTIADSIPMGQPILVGHHSEKRHRRDIDRMGRNMDAGVEHSRKADEMSSRAANIEAAADRAIYSDDVDAVEALRERIEGLEAERERVKAVNKAVRAHGLARLLEPDPPLALTAAESKELLSVARLCPYHKVETRGFPAYHLQNLGGNITRNRKRLEQLEREQAARASGVTIEFDSKPSEEIRTVIKARGFRWDREREVWYRADSADARAFAAYVNEHQDVPPGAAEFSAWVAAQAAPAPEAEPVDRVCPDGLACLDPGCVEERARYDPSRRTVGQCDAVDERGRCCVLVTAHAGRHQCTRAGDWDPMPAPAEDGPRRYALEISHVTAGGLPSPTVHVLEALEEKPDAVRVEQGWIDRELLSPIAEVARDILQAERSAPAIAEVPFSLEAAPAVRRGVQGGLF